jgi:putative ABC transport system permease protein
LYVLVNIKLIAHPRKTYNVPRKTQDMFKLNLKIAWRNLLKYKSYAVVNIVGLALGLAGFIFIVLFINHEESYDKWNPKTKKIYKFQEFANDNSSDKKNHWTDKTDHRFANLISNIQQFEEATMISAENHLNGVTVDHRPPFLQDGIRRSDSLFFKVIPFDFKYGSAETALKNPNSIVLKESLATRYFGNINPLGKIITIAAGAWNGAEDSYIVTGVVKEPQTPTSIPFQAIYFSEHNYFNLQASYGNPSEIYVKTSRDIDLTSINQILQKTYLPLKDKYLQQNNRSIQELVAQGNTPHIKLIPLIDVHQYPLEQKNWKETLRPVILLSVLLLIVSIINFINLVTAQATSRAKEIGIKKVIGAHRKSLVFQFLSETFIQCLVALFISLLLIEISLPTINTFFNLNLSLLNNPNLLTLSLQLLGIVVIVGFLTGAYPALFLASYQPHEVLKGNYSNGKNGILVRKTLVTIQFVVAISFIIGIVVINYQLNYLKERDNGFSTSGLINVRTDLRFKQYYSQLKSIDGVQYVGYSSAVIGDMMANVQTFKFKNEHKDMLGLGVSTDGLQALDARLLEGRFFSDSVVQDTINNVILNESAAKLFNQNMIGQIIMAHDTIPLKVIGVVKDMQVEGFENAVKPSIYHAQAETFHKGVSSWNKQTTLIKFNPKKVKNVVAGLDKIFSTMNGFFPVNYSFVEDDLSAVLVNHERFEKMVKLFSILSLTLSLFGLFALAAFITKQRTREIAVRKVLGAENTDIILLLNKGYIWIILIANAISFPVAYILINRWLATFAYRIQITPLPFVLAFFASVFITIVTVSLQAQRTVKTNPVKALKYE